MDLVHQNGNRLQRTLSISPLPHPHNYGRLTQKECLLIGVCALIGFGLIWQGKRLLGDD